MSASVRVDWEDAVMRHTVQRISTIGAAYLQVRTIDALCPLYRADEATAAETFGGNAPFWPFLWAGGWAVASHLLGTTRLLDDSPEPVVSLDLGCGGGVCTLAALAAASGSSVPPPLAMVANDIDPVALAATRINVRRTIAGNRHAYPWLQGLSEQDVEAAVDRRLLLDQRNLLTMSGAQLCDVLHEYVRLANSVAPHQHCSTAATDSQANAALTPPAQSKLPLHSLPLPSLVVLLGDMMYDSDTGRALLTLVRTLLTLEADAADDATRRAALGRPSLDGQSGGDCRAPLFRRVIVLMGDPGRYAFKQLVTLQPPSQPAVPRSTEGSASVTQQSLGLTARLVGEYSPPVVGSSQSAGLPLSESLQSHGGNAAAGTVTEPEDLPCPVEGVDGFESAAGGSVAVVQLSLR